MSTLATPEDIAKIWRPLTGEEETTASGLIAQASAQLRGWVIDRGYDLDTLIAGDVVRVEIVKFAIAAAAKRVLQNPDGVLSSSWAIDDYREDERRDSAVSTGANYINSADLTGLLPRVRSRLGTISMGRAL